MIWKVWHLLKNINYNQNYNLNPFKKNLNFGTHPHNLASFTAKN